MQKKNPNKNKLIKQTIIITAIALLLLLLIFAEDIIKLANKNKLNLAENNNAQTIATEPNPPTTSAGIIPIKWNGENWVITTKTDKDWYDYKSGKPAYMMLNDGVYQSELQVDMTNKKLAEENIGMKVQPDELGTIFIWIPSFAINENGSDIKYIKDIQTPEEGWTKPEMFTYKQASETYPDFLLTGIWFEKDVDNAYTSKINQMNQEESIYEFIRNTVAVPSDQETGNQIQQYIANLVGATSVRNTQENLPNVALSTEEYPSDITNPNRIILKIVNTKNQDPIKAKASYNKGTGLIEVQVTYSQYGVEKILYQDAQELKLTKNGKQATATSEGINLEYGIAKITIIDNQGNTKELELAITSKVFVTLYTDGTLGFCSNNTKIAGKTVSQDYGDISGKNLTNPTDIPWFNQDNSPVKTVEFVNKIAPNSTMYWFYRCNNLTTINNIENLNTSNVTSMVNMFGGCNSLETLDVSSFDTGNVTNMNYMFSGCSSLTSLDVSGFDTSNVTDMYCMFSVCSSLTTLDVSSFDTSNVTSMVSMFSGCSNLASLNLNNIDTSKVNDMLYMFAECKNLTTLDLSSFDTSNVTNMQCMFQNCYNLTNIDLSSFDTSNVTNMQQMFLYCRNLDSINLSSFNTRNVTNMSSMFFDCNSVTNLDLSNFDTTNVIYMGGMFSNCNNLININLSNFDTSNVTHMSSMFSGCSALTTLDVSNFKTGNVTDMAGMFNGCSSLTTLDLSNFDTSNVANMSWMFAGCSGITALDLSDFKTDKVTNMYRMFYGSNGLTELNLNKLNISNVTNMQEMFYGCSSLTTLDLSSFITSSVTTMYQMFYNCSSLTTLDLSNFDTRKTTNMRYMFYRCGNLKTIYVPRSTTLWPNDISSSSKGSGMFSGCGTSTVTRK